MNFTDWKTRVLNELEECVSSFAPDQAEMLFETVLEVRRTGSKIVGIAAGRMGFSLRAFLMRLNHLGIPAYFVSDTYVPPLSKTDLLLVCSSSGRTPNVLHYVRTARKTAGPRIFAVTGDGDSPMARLSDGLAVFRSGKGKSVQPMNTLGEQAVLLFFDTVTLMLMERLKITSGDMRKNHANVE